MTGKRLTIYFPSEAAAALAALVGKCNLGDGPAILRAAIELYAGLIELKLRGTNIVLLRDDGETVYDPFRRLYPEREARLEAQSDGGKEAGRNFAFADNVVTKIEWVKAHSYLKTSALVVRAALSSFRDLVDADQAGEKMVLRGANGGARVFSPLMPLEAVAIAA